MNADLFWTLVGILGSVLSLAIMVYTLWYGCWWKPVKRATCWSCCQEQPEEGMIALPDSSYQRGRFVCRGCFDLMKLGLERQ